MLFEIYLMCAKKLDNGLFTLEKHFLDHQLSFQDQITLRLLFKMGATLFTFLALPCVSKIEFVKKLIQNGHFSPQQWLGQSTHAYIRSQSPAG